MTKRKKKTFGSLVREERELRKIGLREMARQIGVSPTYLSLVERDEFRPQQRTRSRLSPKSLAAAPR